jgi:hypothetical protein
MYYSDIIYLTYILHIIIFYHLPQIVTYLFNINIYSIYYLILRHLRTILSKYSVPSTLSFTPGIINSINYSILIDLILIIFFNIN